MADVTTDAAIALRFPVEWAKANNPGRGGNSKRRQKLRMRYRMDLEREAFRVSNPDAACSSCANQYLWKGALTCALDNDFDGYQLVKPLHFCTRWEPLAAADPTPRIASHPGPASVNTRADGVGGKGRS